MSGKNVGKEDVTWCIKQERIWMRWVNGELESTLNVRFWNGSLHLLAAQSVEKQPEEIGLEDLDRAIEDLREEKWQGQLNLIFDKIFWKARKTGEYCVTFTTLF